MQENHERLMSLVLRLGVAFVFVYPAIGAIQDPTYWMSYFPSFMLGRVPDLVLSLGFAVFELILAVWIVSGKKIFIPSVLMSLMLIGIIVFNFSKFGVLFRNVAILSATLALAIHSYSFKRFYK